jgi:hypothetical protein
MLERLNLRKTAAFCFSALSLITLTACGGGGGGSSDADAAAEAERLRKSQTPTPTPTPTSPTPTPTSPTPTATYPAALVSSSVWPPAYNGAAFSTSKCSTALTGHNRTFNVGPNQTYQELTDVPWLTLTTGDVVNIYYRSTPYRTYVALRGRGTLDQPITINGVTDANCNRPLISGDGAVPATDAKTANFWPDGQGSGAFIIARGPSDSIDTYIPANIAIQNLAITGVIASTTFTSYAGAVVNHPMFSAGIYANRVENLLVQNCEIYTNGLGVFTNSIGDRPAAYSANVTLRANRIENNGYDGDDHYHNIYVQARRALYEGNYLGQARGGSSLKDRSSAPIVRFNRILAGTRALDLVETEENLYYPHVSTDPIYDYGWVYGNLIVNDHTLTQPGATRMVHWGFDNSTDMGHKGTLYFFGNTVYNHGTSGYAISAFHIGASWGGLPPGLGIQAWDNVFTSDGSDQWNVLYDDGPVVLKGANYLPTNWIAVHSGSGTVQTSGSTVLTGNSSVVSSTTFFPSSGSVILNRGNTFTPNYSAVQALTSEFTSANLGQVAEFVNSPTIGDKAKVLNGIIDIGAFELQ